MHLEIVTLAFNNPLQVKRTLSSIALQGSRPERHIVLDGSSAEFAREIKLLAASVEAHYVWKPPHGVYPAMNDALEVVSPAAHVWFVNSSDWLASPETVRVVRESYQSGDVWLVGGLHRYRDQTVPFHPLPTQPEELIKLLRNGEIGFPHPSSVMLKSAIEECGGFDVRYKIASDYALALEMATRFGTPRMFDSVLAVHDPTGLTSRHRVRHFMEKSRARREHGVSEVAEIKNLSAAILSSVSSHTRPSRNKGGRILLEPFSKEEFGSGWPEDCIKLLDAWPQ